ncbi:MAG: type II secretion system protein [bacterium]|nr:type II secretion system GspH family protein [bacterium]MBU1919021.1 type II secretion system GspH family protein [bacterium]
MNNKGFTLIELILVIAILGILAVSAMPKIFSLTSEAHTAARDGIGANVNAGITLAGAKTMAATGIETYPTPLDAVPPNTLCSRINPCFNAVVKDGVTRDWKKNSDFQYIHLPTNSTYGYDLAGPNKGTFTLQ